MPLTQQEIADHLGLTVVLRKTGSCAGSGKPGS
jgi:hypothetical protein